MRRTASLTAALLLAASLSSVAGADVPADDLPADAPQAERVAGEDRYATAARSALRAFPNGADQVVLAVGTAFPDALAASYLAGLRSAPLLLTAPGHLPTPTRDALSRLEPTSVFIVGGESAVSAAIEDRLVQDYGEDDVRRVSGRDRIGTAAAIASEGGTTVGRLPDLSEETDASYRTAIVALATEFPDAMAAGPLAYAGSHPILLAYEDELPTVTQFLLQDGDLAIEQVVIVGGEAAISDGVHQEIAELDNIRSVARVAGRDRTDTAARMAALTTAALDWPAEQASIAVGTDFPDALTLAPLAAIEQAPLVLASSSDALRGPAFAALQLACNTLDGLIVAGGQAALQADTVNQARLAAACADYPVLLSGAEEAPHDGDPDAVGSAWLFLGAESICYGVQVERLDEITAAHIHEGERGTAGPPVADLTLPDASGYAADCVEADDMRDGMSLAQLHAALHDRPQDFYVNVHTTEYPDGAIRGQVVVAPSQEE